MIKMQRMDEKEKFSRWCKNFAQLVSRREDGGVRLDAGETFALENQLEKFLAESFDIEHGPLKFRQWFPVRNTVGPAAESFAYAQYEGLGKAEIISEYASDLPSVQKIARKFTGNVVSVGASYQISLMDLRQSAMLGKALDPALAATAMRVIEQKLQSICLSGDTLANLTGFFNIAAVTPVAVTTGAWVATPATPEQCFADIVKLWVSIPTATLQNHYPNSLLLPQSVQGFMQQNRTYTDLTLEQYVRANLPGLQNLDYTSLLDTGVWGATTRMVAYEKNPMVGWAEVCQEYEQLAPQWNNLAYKVPCHARTAGCIVPYPLAFGYMDGI